MFNNFKFCFIGSHFSQWMDHNANFWSLQDEALLVLWKQQLDKDAETLKMKGNLNHLRTVRILLLLYIIAFSFGLEAGFGGGFWGEVA